MNEVKVAVGKSIFAKTQVHLRQEIAQQNLYLHKILTGKFAPQLPHYARLENFDTIRNHLNQIEFIQGYVEDACEKYGLFDVFNLSNIFEYLPVAACQSVSEKLCKHARPGARFAYWNLMVPRNLSSYHPEHLQHNQFLSEQLTAIDNGFFYHRFQLDIRNSWINN
jgi:S-adenosylmethionine-diacylglycerol 3-amino-3-carboxypropyl transferase